MKTDPFSDSWSFLLGQQPDQAALGPLRVPFVILFAALLVGSVLIALACRRDPLQRSGANGWIWLFRVLIGCMWFQESLWKMPFPVSGGFAYWTGQMAENAAFPFFADIVTTYMIPNLAIVDPAVFAVEMGLAVSLMLGILVRPVAVLGVLYTAGLWIGLYRNGAEWPWEYVFIMVIHGFFAVTAAGHRLGLDALLGRRPGRRL